MSPVIRIDDEVWRALQQRAVPFEDTPNDVLRRLLALQEPRPSARKPPAPRRTPQREFRIPILETLEELGGGGTATDVLRRLAVRMKNRLNPYDWQPLPKSEQTRWHNTARWERWRMVREGLLRADSPRGIWEMTDKGREYLRAHREAAGKTTP